MSEHSAIEWTDATWNPVVGCTKVSPGCKNCYAKTLHDQRHTAHAAGKAVPKQYAQPFEVVQLMPDRLTDPLAWKKPKRVFVNSVSDLFHEDVPDEFIDKVFGVMALAQRHTFQVLTKRPDRMAAYIARLRSDSEGRYFLPAMFEHVSVQLRNAGDEATRERFLQAAHDHQGKDGWPLRNVWLGVSVENQAAADERIPPLLRTPAAVRFLSVEPMLGPVDLRLDHECGDPPHAVCPPVPDWVIVGGESGPGARPCNVEWVRSIVGQCRAAGVSAFVKQLGAVVEARSAIDPIDQFPGNGMTFRQGRDEFTALVALGDKKGGDPAEWPADLRVREFPATAGAAP